MRARAGLAVIVVAAVWLGAGCGGTKPEAFRIGILTDCFGPFSTLYETSVASAELPLLKRGGRLVGKQAVERRRGRQSRRPAGELEIGCVSGSDDVIPVDPPSGRRDRSAGDGRAARPAGGDDPS